MKLAIRSVRPRRGAVETDQARAAGMWRSPPRNASMCSAARNEQDRRHRLRPPRRSVATELVVVPDRLSSVLLRVSLPGQSRRLRLISANDGGAPASECRRRPYVLQPLRCISVCDGVATDDSAIDRLNETCLNGTRAAANGSSVGSGRDTAGRRQFTEILAPPATPASNERPARPVRRRSTRRCPGSSRSAGPGSPSRPSAT